MDRKRMDGWLIISWPFVLMPVSASWVISGCCWPPRERVREGQRAGACVRTQTRTPMNTKRERRDWRWNLEMYRPSDFGVRCRIIISIIPDPNYDGINSRPESESTRKEEGVGWAWTEKKWGRSKGRVGWRSKRGPLKEEHKQRKAPINFSLLTVYANNIRLYISDWIILIRVGSYDFLGKTRNSRHIDINVT